MRILLLGNGGREHALAWKIDKSPYCSSLFIAPGNGGTIDAGNNQVIDPLDFSTLRQFCLDSEIDMVIVGPEAPLVGGIKEDFHEDPATRHIPIVGPSQRASMLEGSKEFAKEFMEKYQIPTAAYRSFTPEEKAEGIKFIESGGIPVVLKADGLAAGKGVIICQSKREAIVQFGEMLDGKFGDASKKVVIEEFLDGIEFSVFVITDGRDYKILPVAKDYKRIGEGDRGPNTGGMGSVSPVPFVDNELMQKVVDRIIQPTIEGIDDEALDYKGFIFFGLISVQGDPYVIEYNCRMGDPETQVVIPRLENDLVILLKSLFEGTLGQQEIIEDPRYAVATVIASDGYPGNYEKGKKIDLPAPDDDTILFHAGTTLKEKELYTNGGRVMAAVGLGKDLRDARERSRKLVESIHFEGKYFRSDIGFDL